MIREFFADWLEMWLRPDDWLEWIAVSVAGVMVVLFACMGLSILCSLTS